METKNSEHNSGAVEGDPENCLSKAVIALQLDDDSEESKRKTESLQEECVIMRHVIIENEELFKSIEGDGVIGFLAGELRRILAEKGRLSITCVDANSYRTKITQIVEQAIAVFDQHEDCALQVSRLKYWKARGYLLLESFNRYQEAAVALSKAVKLDPVDVLAWNKLGEIYCFLHESDLAERCFISALNLEKNVNSLHNLSILMRKKYDKTPAHYEQGLKYAKEALALDFSNNKSWAILGNAYLSEFFSRGQNESSLRKALQAYSQAEKEKPGDVEIAANSFVALKFLEDYDAALKCLSPCLTQSNVIWKEMQGDYNSLLSYLKKIQELVDKKGKLRAKKRIELVKTLNTFSVPREIELSSPRYPIIHGVTIGVLCPSVSYPYTAAILTAMERVYIVTIFNLHTRRGLKSGDILSVPTKSATDVNIIHREHVFNFPKLRITCPMDIAVNGKRMTPSDCNPFSFVSNQEN